MSLASDDATHFWEDKLRNLWQSSTEKMQQLTTSRRHQNNLYYFECIIISLVILGCLLFLRTNLLNFLGTTLKITPYIVSMLRYTNENQIDIAFIISFF